MQSTVIDRKGDSEFIHDSHKGRRKTRLSCGLRSATNERIFATWTWLLVCGALVACGTNARNEDRNESSAHDDSPVFTADEAVRICAKDGACVSRPKYGSGAECVHKLQRAYKGRDYTEAPDYRFAQCALSTTGCEDLLACASLDHGPEYCTAHPGSSCDGHIAVNCPTNTLDRGWALGSIDCSLMGMTCNNGGCTDGNTCDGPVVLHCSGTKVVACVPELRRQSATDCSQVYPGGRCGGHFGTLQCLPTEEEECGSQTGNGFCSGNLLLGCDGPRKSTLNCDALDSECGIDFSFFQDCIPRAQDCTRTSPDSCQGNDLSLCVNGRYQNVDCGSLGLGPCHVTVDGAAACASDG